MRKKFGTTQLCRVRKILANCMLHSFSPCNPLVKTKLVDSFCYGSALWFSSSSELGLLELRLPSTISSVAFGLSLVCITLAYFIVQLNSTARSSRLLSAALKSQSSLIRTVTVQSSTVTHTIESLEYTYNLIYGSHHKQI